MIGRLRLTSSRARCGLTGCALIGVAALAVIIGVWTRTGQGIDAWVFDRILEVIPATPRRALDAFARPFAPLALTPPAVVLMLLGVRRGRWGETVSAAALTGLIPLIRWLREDVITRPDLGVSGYTYNTFPSTHAAAGFVLVAAILILWPVPPHRVVLFGAGVIAFAIGLGNVAWYAHRPVDVAGSAGLVAGCALVLLAVLPYRQWRARASRLSQTE